MIQTPVQYCDCCGLAVDTWAGEDCPRCSYPISPPKEKRFLASAIRDLQRVAFHGGGNFTVVGLIRRYQTRLNYLDQFNVAPVPARPPAVPPSRVAPAQSSVPPVEKSSEIVPLPHGQPDGHAGAAHRHGHAGATFRHRDPGAAVRHAEHGPDHRQRHRRAAIGHAGREIP